MMPSAALQGFKSVDVAVLWPKGYTQFHGQHSAVGSVARLASCAIVSCSPNQLQHAGCAVI
jgi:hypothetical protein